LDPVRPDEYLDPAPPPFASPADERFFAPAAVWRRTPKFQDRVWLHVTLFALTIATTTLAGVGHYVSFISDFRDTALTLPPLIPLMARGLWYAGTILAILGCHELGHYFACRYYDVDASLPYFLPIPFVLTGTLGAFIRIREPIPSKRMLFDIGIAGPLAGFVVAVPALFIGMAMSHVVRLPTQFVGYELGEPLLFKFAEWSVWGSVPDGYSVNMHPVAFAAWFGLLATALNLFPIGQLDGGHISYSVLGDRSTWVTRVMIVIALILTYFSMSWLVWTLLMIGMLWAFGARHPRTFDERIPLDRTRFVLALVALLIFIVCFTPMPIEPMQLIRR
jgi:membrane-associated protease RseP (regulator of RpoE activity)